KTWITSSMPSILEIRNSLGLGSSAITALLSSKTLSDQQSPGAQKLQGVRIPLIVGSAEVLCALQGSHHEHVFVGPAKHRQSLDALSHLPAEQQIHQAGR